LANIAAAARFESRVARRGGRYYLPLPEGLDPLWEALEAEGREAHVTISLPGGGIVDISAPVSRLNGRFALALPEDLGEAWGAARRSRWPARVDLVVPGRRVAVD
jgi:hypothetical protein